MSTDATKLVVSNNEGAQRFETTVDDAQAVVEYRRSDDQITFMHTKVPRALKGRGIGGKLAAAALEYAHAQQLKVVPRCTFIAAYIREHPEHQPLVAPEARHLVEDQ